MMARSSIEKIASGKHTLWSSGSDLRAIEDALAGLEEGLVAQRLLVSVSEDGGVREASANCGQEMEELRLATVGNPRIHAIALNAARRASRPADAQLARAYIEAGNRAGANLPDQARAQVKDLLEQIGRLESEYQQSLAEDRTSIQITAAEGASLPPGLLATLEKNPDGYVVPVHLGTWELFMKNAASADARRRFLLAFYDRGGGANSARVIEAVRLRAQIAQLSGFDSWAAYQLDTQMAKTSERALALVTEVGTKLLPKSREEIATLSALKAKSGDATPFAAWDYLYYQEQLERERFALDSEQVRQYFPVQHVIRAVMDLYQGILGVKFHPVAPAQAWAADVQQLRITDAKSDVTLGWAYLDLAPRPAKFLRPASFPLRAGRYLDDGTYRTPLSAIIGNGPAAAAGGPALFTHKDAVDFFHEFGHLMHTTLSRTRYASLYGARVRDDFVEAPSQMLENWMWNRQVLRRVSKHVDTGKALPDALIDRLLERKHAADGVFWTRQAFLAAYDLALHSGTDKQAPDPDALWFELMPRYTALPAPGGTHPAASFMPVMGGYDAGYYGYLWSRVYAQDMFTAFERDGLENPAVGARYRREILEPGATAEPEELLRNFLGRPLSYAAFYEDVGMKQR